MYIEEVQSLIRYIIHLVNNTHGPEGIKQLMDDMWQVKDSFKSSVEP